MKYDDASWHYGGEFPADSPKEYGAIHIGLFLKWCFVNDFEAELHANGEPDQVEAVKNGTMEGTAFLLSHCDEKLTDADVNEAGQRFAAAYYGSDGLYLEDYATVFESQMYTASESEICFEKFSKMVSARWESGVLTSTQLANQKKPWWRFW